MTEDDANDDQNDGFAGDIDSEEFAKPATRGDLYGLMLIVRLNQVIVETALIALDRQDDETLKRKLDELDKAGEQASKFVRDFGKRLRKKNSSPVRTK